MKLNNIYNGDCLGLMSDIPDRSVNMILCDLPFGCTVQKWDKIIDFDKLWEHYERIRKPDCSVLLFGNEPFSSKLRMSNINNFRYDWVWHKSKPSGMVLAKTQPMRNHEIISCFYKGNFYPIKEERVGFTEKSKKRFNSGESLGSYKNHGDSTSGVTKQDKVKKIESLRNPTTIKAFGSLVNRNGKNLHPTQKPIDLLEYLIKTYTKKGELVLDNTCGSGSTCLAARNVDRQFIGIEKDENYFDIAKKRLDLN